MREFPGLTPGDQACAQIAAWRGRCINLFSRGEAAVIRALEAAIAKGHTITIKHLAGQRTADLEWLTRNETGTVKQRQALSNALAGWAELEARRAYIAHGVVTVRVDKNGLWRARVDFTAYRNGPGEKCRWSFSRTEADDFEMSLERGFRALSAQLGHLRKRLAA